MIQTLRLINVLLAILAIIPSAYLFVVLIGDRDKGNTHTVNTVMRISTFLFVIAALANGFLSAVLYFDLIPDNVSSSLQILFNVRNTLNNLAFLFFSGALALMRVKVKRGNN
jgi:uncharacterized membrane protein